MVPSSTELISMTFFTVCEAVAVFVSICAHQQQRGILLPIQFPAVALESVATIMPPWKRKASVVVPCAILIGQFGLLLSSVAARSHADGCCRTVSICASSSETGDHLTWATGGIANFNDRPGAGSPIKSSLLSSQKFPSFRTVVGRAYRATRVSILLLLWFGSAETSKVRLQGVDRAPRG
jgi:hypothetical protein